MAVNVFPYHINQTWNTSSVEKNILKKGIPQQKVHPLQEKRAKKMILRRERWGKIVTPEEYIYPQCVSEK